MTSTLDRASLRANLDSFSHRWSQEIDRWREEHTTATEKRSAQRFWIELFECFGVSATSMDIFEQSAKRLSTGGGGYIDLFWPGRVIGEAKSLGVDLDRAQQQIVDYLAGGDVPEHAAPQYTICHNFESLRVTRMGAPEDRFDVSFPLEEASAHIDQLSFLAGFDTVSAREEEAASITASDLMADLFTAMAGDDADEAVGDDAAVNPEDEDARVQHTSMYLTRLLFLLFGDDSGLWDSNLFQRFVVEETTPSTLGSQLNALFDVLNTPPEKRSRRLPETLAAFPYVNGAIFADSMPLEYFSPEMHEALLKACDFDWSKISPAVFGSLFQQVKSKEARRSDGEHYTSETNILKTIGPLFLDELRAEADRLIAAKSGSVKKRVGALQEFHERLASMTFCDPACGCGNFLVVAYRELRRIETDVIVALRKLQGLEGDAAFDVSWEQKLSIGQFYGFEINWWPAKIAETAMFLVDHQANRELARAIGVAPERLPISITAHITHDNALEFDWAEVLPATTGTTYIFGNPPFIGQFTKTKEQTEDMKRVWGKDYDGYLDYVTAWHAQAKRFYAEPLNGRPRPGEFAYVTTNSITQGQPVPALFGPLFEDGWRIKFAHRTFAWDSEAPGKAAVHCVIVGFTKDLDTKQRLWDYDNAKGAPKPVALEHGINAYLADGANVLVTKRSKPLSPAITKAVKGSQPTDSGHLIVEAEDYPSIAADPIAVKYLRKFTGSREMVRGLDRWCLWMEDLDSSDIKKSEILRERIEEVRDFRLQSKKNQTQEFAQTPHLFTERRPAATQYLCIPSVVSELRKFFTAEQYPSEVICSNLAFQCPDPDGLQFGLISSSMFITWQRAVGGRLESRLRFANTLTWNTFPVPELTDKQRADIIAGGKAVLEARALHPERSLADHYNPLAMDPALLAAHKKLDAAVDKAFGASRKLTTYQQRLELLFANYVRLTHEQ